MRYIVRVGLGAASAVALAGCGGSGSSSASSASFTTQASAICKRVNHAVAALPAMNTTADLLSTGTKEISLSRAAIAQLMALNPPSAERGTFKQYLGGLTRETTIVQKALAAIKAGDLTQAKLLAAQGNTLDAINRTRARRLGLPACTTGARPGSQSGAP